MPRIPAIAATVALLLQTTAPLPAAADNPMGYRLLSQQEASSLPRRHGTLGLEVERAQQISDDGMMFDIIRITRVHAQSAAAHAGLRVGDQIVAVDGRVFASVAAFAGYVGSLPPGSRASFDAIPSGGTPSQAERVAVIMGGGGQPAESEGMSTRTKIGIGAAALLGCYMLGCFSKKTPPPQQTQPQ